MESRTYNSLEQEVNGRTTGILLLTKLQERTFMTNNENNEVEEDDNDDFFFLNNINPNDLIENSNIIEEEDKENEENFYLNNLKPKTSHLNLKNYTNVFKGPCTLKLKKVKISVNIKENENYHSKFFLHHSSKLFKRHF